MKRLLLLAVLWGCGGPYQPDRDDVWLYPEDVLFEEVINNSATYYFDISRSDYEKRRGSYIWIYWSPSANEGSYWTGTTLMPSVTVAESPLFGKLVLQTLSRTGDWEYITFEWDAD